LELAARPAAAVAARRQAAQRQPSSDSGEGMGSRTGSAAHQQSPPGLHAKAAPQRAHCA
jgi:hypothetical protein